MNPREFVEVRTKRSMAQVLEGFERRIEDPLTQMLESDTPVPTSRIAEVVTELEQVKRDIRKKLQALGEDCLDLMPSHLEINGFEPVVRR